MLPKATNPCVILTYQDSNSHRYLEMWNIERPSMPTTQSLMSLNGKYMLSFGQTANLVSLEERRLTTSVSLPV